MDAGDRNWAISGVSLRSADVAQQMLPQDCLYTVGERSDAGQSIRLVGAVRELLVAPRQPREVVERISAPATRIVSLTVTEKGYCRKSDGSLDPALANDTSLFRFLSVGLRLRQASGHAGLTLVSCDNLAKNGRQLQQLIGEYLALHDPGLIGWFEQECTCPSSMVDRIVPATTDADKSEIARSIGLDDHAAVMTEPFSQWVIEDKFIAGRPAWEQVGAQLVNDVAPYETAKLRMLNGAHSALAYLGLARGHSYVHEAVADPNIRPLVETLMRAEAAESIKAAAGQDLQAYADALLNRFANSSLGHRLAQIAIDGSQKIPQRWLETLAYHQETGRGCSAILTALAAWLRHVRGDNGPVDDPLAKQLAGAWVTFRKEGILDGMMGPNGILRSNWNPTNRDRAAIATLL